MIDRVPIGSRPQRLSLSLDGETLFVALGGAASVAVLDLDTLAKTEILVGDVIRSSLTYDVVEAAPGRVFVAAELQEARLGRIDLDQAGEVAVVASGELIDQSPRLEVSPDGQALYVRNQVLAPRLFKVDLSQESAPVVLSTAYYDLTAAEDLAVSPDGARLYMSSGQVVATETSEWWAPSGRESTSSATTPASCMRRARLGR